MNVAKKIIVVLLAVTLLVSCFALFSSAEVPRLSVDDLDDVFEYHYYRDIYYEEDDNKVNGYLQANYEDYANGDNYPQPTAKPTADVNKYFKYLQVPNQVESKIITDPDDSDNKILVVRKTKTTRKAYLAKYRLGNSKSTENITESLVMTFDVKFGGEDGYLKITADDVIYFAINVSDSENPTMTYCAYDPNLDTDTAMHTFEGLTPQFDKWYTVEAVMNFAGNELVIDVFERDNPENKTTTGMVMFSPNENDVVGAKLVELDASGTKDAEASVYFDNIKFYEGTAIRDINNPGKAINNIVIQADEIAKADATSLERRVEIAEFFEKLFYNEQLGMKYVPDAESDEQLTVDKVNAVKAASKVNFNRAYAESLIQYAHMLEDETLGYYDRAEIYGKAEVFYNFFASDAYKNYFDYANEEFDSLDEFVGVENLVDDLDRAIKICAKVPGIQNGIKVASIGYVDLIATFDHESRDYKYISDILAAIDLFTDYDATFKYAEELGITDESNQKYKYQTVDVAVKEYEVIKRSIDEVNAKGKIFTDAVYAMKDEPSKTQGFAAICNNYAAASSVFKNGTIHDSIDMSTYPDVNGISMLRYIEIYNARKSYVESRIAESEEFIRLVESAFACAVHSNALTYLNSAAPFLDENINEKSLETEHPGVNDAIAKYNSLRQKLADDVVNAGKYKAAVNNINIDSPYATLKASVDAALALKTAGAVVGIEGVKEANIKLSEADSKVRALEGNSTTLIASVNSLKDAKTLAERRELIFIATNAAAGAEDSIAGVTAAKAALAEATSKFNADVEAANADFFTAVNNAADVSASASDAENAYKFADIIKALLKK